MEGRPDTRAFTERSPLTVGSLFAGIGGFDLGLERAGMRTRWFVEQDPFCQRVLAKHWPGVPCYPDVRVIQGCVKSPDARKVAVDFVDVLCGGFPCPSESQAARGRNVAPWMWPPYARMVRELRPRYVIVENVAGLLYRRRIGEVLGDLAELGYDAEWTMLRASEIGAPHPRPRVWLVAYAHEDGESDRPVDAEALGLSQLHEAVREWPDPPSSVGVDDGVSGRLDRLRALGNALVPQIAEWIGQRIMEWEANGRPAREG